MDWKKFGKAILFPHIAVMLLLLPVAIAFMVYSLISLSPESVVAIISYVLAFYTLTVWCLRIPIILRFYRDFKEGNKFAQRWQDDANLRVNISLYGSLLWNTAYAVFQLYLGYIHSTFWFYSIGVYYVLLAVMRLFLVRHSSRHKPGEKMRQELTRYRTCGIILLVMNLALTVMIFFMVYWNRTFHHHEITTIAMAAYTFGTLTMAIINVVKYRKYNSPVYSASKAINLAAACVSMLTLESTMLTTFGDGTMTLTGRRILLAASGGAISLFIILMATSMIVSGTKKIKQIKEQSHGS